MILAIDVGNTNIVLGCIDDGDIRSIVRIQTNPGETAAEYAIKLKQILEIYDISPRAFEGAIISSVVPPLTNSLKEAVRKLTGIECLVVGPGMRTGMNVRIDDPGTLAGDLVVGSVAAMETYGAPVIVLDMGTATTISYISSKRSYEGGLMFPGVRLSLDALSDHTAQLPDISLQHPKSLIGKNTEDCMRSGIVYGTAGMLDGVIDRIRELLPQGETPTIVATGSNAPVIVRYCRNKVLYDKYLLMEGLWDIYQKNH